MIRLTLLLFVLVISSQIVQAIAVSPNKLEFEVYEGNTQTRQFKIFNILEQEQAYEIRQINYKNTFSISNERGVIDSKTDQTIMIKLNQNIPPGNYSEKLLIESKGENSNNLLELGTIIEVKIMVKKQPLIKKFPGEIITLTIVGVGILAYYLFK